MVHLSLNQQKYDSLIIMPEYAEVVKDNFIKTKEKNEKRREQIVAKHLISTLSLTLLQRTKENHLSNSAVGRLYE